jgi:hypothetical protein
MQSAKSGVSRVLGLPAKLISVPEATIRGCHVLTVTDKRRLRKNYKRKRKLYRKRIRIRNSIREDKKVERR